MQIRPCLDIYAVRISIAVCEPVYEVNVGHIARLMMNFGLEELLLIEPKVDLARARIFAAHAASIVDRARIVHFEDILRMGFDIIVGSTSTPSSDRSNIIRDAVDASMLAGIVRGKDKVCLLLGRESTGLTNEELARCDVVVSINTPTDYKALNISHALAIILYEIFRDSSMHRVEYASREEIDLLIKYAVDLAKVANTREYRIPMIETAIRRIMGRSTATSKEVMLIVSLLRSAILAIKRAESRSLSQNA
ncbi:MULTISPECIES: RNA methyltransferase [Candidatus Nitrosocaldus]|jgi:TrmH family RNA methyltransferase|uniref:Putative RNA methyltransferase n=1 Tax=Candidatus Nitrosocaldus cavascurensis TaxID=2058097 RepID=A0A2K5ATD3_9ARCH|nr:MULTISPECIES: TrmH family RNA methyltransferase [Candidatus Nitrosocaldus]SPC34895.1 putative RNA methyltransferase [Candidatus Nitrosocaldus cavascurensis]